ncbi:MAG TPA: DUF72 domain-containing protein [Candidatus Binatia bacterium]|nr:DUF72 domain-containing protein [Candidatus Binatia bacterium]
MKNGPRVRIGTSGYSYPGPAPKGWFGVFYPQSKGKRFDPLEYYCQFFDTVEINSTFYRPPVASMVNAWVRKTPADFEFSVKVWRKFTHFRKHNQPHSGTKVEWESVTQADVDLFRSGIDPLAQSGKLGALLFQHPAGFYCTPENVDRLVRTLELFRDYPKVVELRHKSWSERHEETRALLEKCGASWVLIDEPKFATSIRQEFKPIGEIFYFRAHGRNAAKWWSHKEPWERYDYCYSWNEIKEMVLKLKTATEGGPDRKALVFFNNHARGQSIANAIMLIYEMGNDLKVRPSQELLRAFPQISEIVPPAHQGRLPIEEQRPS